MATAYLNAAIISSRKGGGQFHFHFVLLCDPTLHMLMRSELVRQLGCLPVIKQRKTHLTEELILFSFILITRLKEVF